MTSQTLKGILVLVVVFLLLMIFKNIYEMISKRNLKRDAKREKELNFDTKRTSSQDLTSAGLIDTVTSPVRKYIMPQITIDETKMDQLNKDIKLSGWNEKGFDAFTFTALDYTLKILGILFFLIFCKKSMFIACIWFFILFFLLKLLFNNSVKDMKFGLMTEFPDFIRITQGFLTSDIPLVEAIENSIPYVGSHWKPILKDFVIEANVYSQDECINALKERVPIFEVHELWSLIQLNIEQGIDIKESFNNQAIKVREMQKEVMLNKINKRQLMATAVQAPLMLCMMGGFMLPTLNSMVNLNLG